MMGWRIPSAWGNKMRGSGTFCALKMFGVIASLCWLPFLCMPVPASTV